METQSMQMQAMDDEIEIDLMEILMLMLRKAHYIIGSTVICAVLVAIVTAFFITPQYESTASIYILNQTTSLTSMADLQMSESLTSDFQVFAKSRTVFERVIRELNLDTKYETLLETVEVANLTDTRILTITVTNPDPQLAADISNALAQQLKVRVSEIMITDEPTTVEPAVAAENPVSPSLVKNTMIAALVGLFLSAGVILVVYLMDDTIKDAADVEKYLHMTTLASIPVDVTANDQQQAKNKKGGFVGRLPQRMKTSSVAQTVPHTSTTKTTFNAMPATEDTSFDLPVPPVEQYTTEVSASTKKTLNKQRTTINRGNGSNNTKNTTKPDEK